jgi:dTDP-4-dehydrorhamnose reductase
MLSNDEIFIVGANGQLGTALRLKYPGAKFADIGELDITNATSVAAYDWSGIKVIINAAAYTNVDGAETAEGRLAAWSVNATAIANLARTALALNLILVHVSSDYVFDGSANEHSESEAFTPLSVYGSSKAAGDTLMSLVPHHYLIRTSWVIGEGKNFVRTMLELGRRGINPSVVSDQIGRLTFTSELVRAIDHLLGSEAAFGTYNVSNGGQAASWADITRAIYLKAGLANTVTNVTTANYYAGKDGVAPRPLNSTLDLTKLRLSGFISRDWNEDLTDYLEKERSS